MDKNNAELIVKVYAVFFWLGALFSLIGAIGMIFLSRGGMYGGMMPWNFGLGAFGIVFGIIMLALAAFYALTGFGLWGRKEWSRIAALVLCVISLLSFPFGTLLGAFGIYAFGFDDVVKGLFSGNASLAAMRQSAGEASRQAKKIVKKSTKKR